MAISVDQDVLGLEIAVGDALLFMKELEDQTYFGSIKACGFFVECFRIAQICKYLAAGTVVELVGQSAQGTLERASLCRYARNGGFLTIMYRLSASWKLATIVVMKGWPATEARTLRSLRT